MNAIFKSILNTAIVTTGLTVALQASAVPIIYEGTLVSGVTVGGFVRDPALSGAPNDDFWRFSGTAGDEISLIVNRLDSGLDPAMYLYSGTGTDTTALGAIIASGDDDYPELAGFDGPFSDPRIRFTLPSTGDYTVQVWDFASTTPPPVDRCYQITLNGEPTSAIFGCGGTVPEPASIALIGISLVGLVASRRRKQSA